MQAAQKYQACVEALSSFAQGVGFTEAVIGLSGGIDSSVVAVMCADAFGAVHVHGVLLPGPYSSGHSVEDARELAGNLGIEAQTVSICEPFEAFESAVHQLNPQAPIFPLAATKGEGVGAWAAWLAERVRQV